MADGNVAVNAPGTKVRTTDGDSTTLKIPNVRIGNKAEVKAPLTTVSGGDGNGVTVQAPLTTVTTDGNNGVSVRAPGVNVNKPGN